MREIAKVMNVTDALEKPDAGDIPEDAWTKAAANNPAFHFLKDGAENIYTRNDGKPAHDQR